MFNQNKKWFKEIENNKLGRDFIVGDLHGYYSLLMKGLKSLNFDFNKDRLFCVGDLIDRGPEQLLCLSLLKEKWFFAVLGNHEYMFLSEHSKKLNIINKIQSFLYSDKKKRKSELIKYKEYARLIRDLPVMLKVLDEDNPFYLVHAARPIKKGIIWSDDLIEYKKNKKLKKKNLKKMIWGRKLSKEAMLINGIKKYPILFSDEDLILSSTHIKTKQPIENNISITYSGHTIMDEVVLHRSHLFIDGGRYKGGSLRILEHKKIIKIIKDLK